MTTSDPPPAESAARLGALIEAAPAVIYEAETGLDARWRYISPQLHGLIGDSPEAWLADPTAYTRRIHPADRDVMGHVEEDQLEIARREKATCVSEYRMLHREGHLVWVRDEAQLVDNGTEPPFWRGILVDITLERTARNDLTETYHRHRSDRLARGQFTVETSVDVFRVSCRDCQAVRASETPGACPACGSENVDIESMQSLARELVAAQSNVEDLLEGVHRHLEILGISLREGSRVGPDGRRVVASLPADRQSQP
ncbi:MAG: hypothetical protein QOJ01_1607 [Solirubrobacterales bacterium]|jgi:PAS domain S-box-containing protein|nr:hypothetical protein [Solirubrobacterales bacterium]